MPSQKPKRKKPLTSSVTSTNAGSTRSQAPLFVVPSFTEADLEFRHSGLGRLLNVAVRRIEARVIAMMIEAGHTEMRLKFVNLTRNLDLEGTSLTELATRASMTKQAMGELADLCEAIGIVERVGDPADKRMRIIRFTPAGMLWLKQLKEAVAKAEAEVISAIGDAAFEAMCNSLKLYNRAPLPNLKMQWTQPVKEE